MARETANLVNLERSIKEILALQQHLLMRHDECGNSLKVRSIDNATHKVVLSPEGNSESNGGSADIKDDTEVHCGIPSTPFLPPNDEILGLGDGCQKEGSVHLGDVSALCGLESFAAMRKMILRTKQPTYREHKVFISQLSLATYPYIFSSHQKIFMRYEINTLVY